MKLSILIATTSARDKVIKPLLENLNQQISKKPDEVELIINDHETDNVGKKRNDLLRLSKGEYVVFIDSDDEVSKYYVPLILRACRGNPDCIAISGVMTTNGTKPHQWHISKKYKKWYKEGRIFYRTPNHISPIKREIALKAMFPEIMYGEDYEYSMRVLPFLNTENRVKGNIYKYLYNSKK